MTQSETETSYLICHKVRGQPAFDVAVKLEGGIWIIPTSGHRAYPFWLASLTLVTESYMNQPPSDITERMPLDCPDHYSMNDTKPKRMSELTLEDLEM